MSAVLQAILDNLPGILSALGSLIAAVASAYAAIKATQTHTIVSGQTNASDPKGPSQ